MTGSTDLDRMLATYLDEGPRRSPDRPVEAAIAHARSHPRRRDPLAVLRPDVMARRSSMFSPQLAWAALLIVLTLGAVAAIAVGSRPNTVPVVPPPTGIESPSPSPSRSADPTVPPASPSPRSFGLTVVDEHEIEHPVELLDASGTLSGAVAGPVFDDVLEDGAVARNDPADDAALLVAWEFAPCDAPTTITIDAARTTIEVERPRCTGDTLGGNPHQVTLQFAGAIDAAALEVRLVETP